MGSNSPSKNGEWAWFKQEALQELGFPSALGARSGYLCAPAPRLPHAQNRYAATGGRWRVRCETPMFLDTKALPATATQTSVRHVSRRQKSEGKRHKSYLPGNNNSLWAGALSLRHGPIIKCSAQLKACQLASNRRGGGGLQNRFPTQPAWEDYPKGTTLWAEKQWGVLKAT